MREPTAQTPFNLPLVRRATLEDKGGPVVAEAKLEVVAGD